MNESDLLNNEGEKSEEWRSWTPEAFLSTLVHELRTPLMAIKGYAGILSDEARKDLHPTALEHLSISIERLEKVIEGIPEYAHELEKRKPNK
jgi:signal transduction histidine kinase